LTKPSTANRSSDVTSLLFKAVKGLPEEEQRVVFEYFLEREIGTAQPAFFEPFVRRAAELRGAAAHGAWPDPSALSSLFTAQKPMGPEQTMIPVRLSEAQHRRLKQWCAEHNFPMAVVVRGLIERFLDSWEKRAA
jgi:hypothetical protein